MSITRSYNKHTDTYYAYDTTYEWDELAQKKVQRKKCIGKYDPETGEIIPTGKRGRPLAKQPTPQDAADGRKPSSQHLESMLRKAELLSSRLDAIEALMTRATGDLSELRECTESLIRQIKSEE